MDPHLLIESSVGLAREGVRLAATTTAGHGALVAGSVGPYGACLGDGSEYNGKYIGSEGIYIIYLIASVLIFRWAHLFSCLFGHVPF